MRYSHRILFCQENSSDDEIDDLFNRLQQINPPPWLIERIMSSVTRPAHTQQTQHASWLNEIDSLVVRSDHLTPS